MSYMHSYVKLVRAHIVLSVLIYPVFAVEGGWSEPTAISSTVSDQPNISVDLSGNAVLVWSYRKHRHRIPSCEGASRDKGFRAAHRAS